MVSIVEYEKCDLFNDVNSDRKYLIKHLPNYKKDKIQRVTSNSVENTRRPLKVVNGKLKIEKMI